MTESYWRRKARPIIARVIREVGTVDLKALRKALLDAYPFHERKYHPYKIWLDEIRYQLGTKLKKPKTPTRADQHRPDPGQRNLFD